jgi:hypothetical protein
VSSESVYQHPFPAKETKMPLLLHLGIFAQAHRAGKQNQNSQPHHFNITSLPAQYGGKAHPLTPEATG